MCTWNNDLTCPRRTPHLMLALSPGDVVGSCLPRDVTVVLDVSGSMSGAEMEQARQAANQLLGTLDRADRFRPGAFGSGVASYRPGWTAVSPSELAVARRSIDRLAPDRSADHADRQRGRHASSGRPRGGTLTVTGVRNERTDRFSVDAGLADHELGNDLIPRLWATRMIGALMQASASTAPAPNSSARSARPRAATACSASTPHTSCRSHST